MARLRFMHIHFPIEMIAPLPPPPPPPVRVERSENRAINVIRSFAALLVVVGHFRLLFFRDYVDIPHPSHLDLIFYATTSMGPEAVLIFFVLSGYWVGGAAIRAYQDDRFSWIGYSTARLTRLWVVLIPALMLTAIVDHTGSRLLSNSDVYTSPSIYTGIPSNPTHSIVALLGNVVFLQQIHAPIFGMDMPLWSLGYEFWCYAMFPLVLGIIWARRAVRSRIACTLLLALCATVAGPAVLKLGIAWVIGAIVAWQRPRFIVWTRIIPWTVLALVRGSAMLGTLGALVILRQVSIGEIPGVIALAVPTGVLLAALSVDLHWQPIPDRLLDRVSRSANFSYSLYAIHMPLLVLAVAVIVPRSGRRWHLGAGSLLISCVLVTVVAFVAYVFAQFTEVHTDAVRAWLMKRSWNRTRSRHPRTSTPTAN